MDRRYIQQFLKKKIYLERKSNHYRHVGTLLEITDDCILLDDRKTGPMLIDLTDILLIREARPND